MQPNAIVVTKVARTALKTTLDFFRDSSSCFFFNSEFSFCEKLDNPVFLAILLIGVVEQKEEINSRLSQGYRDKVDAYSIS